MVFLAYNLIDLYRIDLLLLMVYVFNMRYFIRIYLLVFMFFIIGFVMGC
jgi:hypothetical protein